MKKSFSAICVTLSILLPLTGHAEQVKDTLQSLLAESNKQSKIEKELFAKIEDLNREDYKQLRCTEMPKVMQKRISINERTVKLVGTKEADEIKQQNKLIKDKIAEAKTQFEC